MSTARRSRAVIGRDPLDQVIPAAPPPIDPAVFAAATQPEPRIRRVRTNFQIPEILIEEARDAVVHLAGPPNHLNLAALIENALRKEIQYLKKRFNDGKDFPTRPHPLRRGRPVS